MTYITAPSKGKERDNTHKKHETVSGKIQQRKDEEEGIRKFPLVGLCNIQ